MGFNRRQPIDWLQRIFLLLLLCVAFALRLYRLDFQELRGDESFGYFFSLHPLSEIVQSTLDLHEPHPVASYFVQHFWLGWSGTSEFSLRFLGVCWSVLTVALLYRLAKHLNFSNKNALLASLLLAISPYAIWHSQDARMYNMSMALTIFTLLLGLEWLEGRQLRHAVGYLLCALLALHTHYYTIYLLFAFYLFVLVSALFRKEQRRSLRRLFIPTVGIVLLYAPWLWYVRVTLLDYVGNGDSPTLIMMTIRSLSAFAVGETVPASQHIGWAAMTGSALIISCFLQLHWRTKSTSTRTIGLLATLFFVPLLLTWFGAQNRPIFNERYLVPLLAPFLLLVTLGSDDWMSPYASSTRSTSGKAIFSFSHLLLFLALAIGMTLSLWRYYNDPNYSKTSGWRELATATINAGAGFSPDRLRWIQNYPDPTLWYYTGDAVQHLVLPPRPNNQQAAVQEVSGLVEVGVERILLVVQPAADWDKNGIAQSSLLSHYTLTTQLPLRKGIIEIYDRHLQTLPVLQAAFVNGVQLSGFATAPQIAVPDGIMAIDLNWQRAEGRSSDVEMSGTEKVSVQLLDSAGQLMAQQDRILELATAPAKTRYALQLPLQLPPGDYRLIVALYDPEQPGAPRIRTTDGREVIDLGMIGSPANQ